MPTIPEKCSRCGAPISWEEDVTSVKCNFCGNRNYSKTRISNVSKNQIIFPIKKFLISKRLLNKNQIDYINNKSKKLFEKRLFRFFILIIFISTPLILIKANTINPKLKALCDEISKNEQTSFAASKTYRNCMKKIKGLNSRVRSQRIKDIKSQCKNINEFQKFHLKLLNKETLSYSLLDHKFNYRDPSLKNDRPNSLFSRDSSRDALSKQDLVDIKENLKRKISTQSEAKRLIRKYKNFGYYIRKLENLAQPSGILTSEKEEKGIRYDFNTCKEELLNEFVYVGDKNNYIFINTYNNWWEDL